MFNHYVVKAERTGVIIIGENVKPIRLNLENFFQELSGLPSSISRELIAIAAGVYAVDRISRRLFKKSHGGIRKLHLTFQVRNLGFWNEEKVRDILIEIITFLTGDDWRIQFEAVVDLESVPRNQDYFGFVKPAVGRIALYSGGLDSAAGLAHQILVNGVRNYLLITVGHQSGLSGRVVKQLDGLKGIAEGYEKNPFIISCASLSAFLKHRKGARIRDQEKSQRSRALFFCSTAVAAADVYGVDEIDMFENGVGAINLPVMTGMLGGGHATRGAHPTFLSKMSILASLVLQRKLSFHLPFQKFTKSEVLKSIVGVPGIPDWLNQSFSCIHTSLREVGISHCGECPACIERLQAFVSAGLLIDSKNYLMDVTKRLPSKDRNKEYLYLYRLDACKWMEDKQDLRRRLDYHLALTKVPSAMHYEIVELQRRHACEVIQTFGSPL